MSFPRIETERLLLRTYKAGDLETVYLLASDSHITRFFPDGSNISREDILASLPRRIERWEQQGFGQFGVFEKHTEKLIGYCGLQYLDKTPEVEIYYGLFPGFWGKGIATEAAKAVLDFGFRQAKLDRIVGVTHPENIASQKVLLNIGLMREKTARFYDMDVVYFAISAEDHNNHGGKDRL
jgi:ribosomal-protein-alanine N-acetyltransferase